MGFPSAKKRLYLPGDAWILALTATIWNMGSSLANPFQSIYFYSLGANAIFIGELLAIGSAITALMQLIGGYVADVWGRRKVVIIFSFVSAASAFVYIFIDQYYLLILPIVLGSIAGIYGPAFNAMLTESMQPELRARGIASFTLVTSIPSIFCPYFGGLLMNTYGSIYGLRIAFFLSGLFGLVGVSYRAWKVTETYSGVVIKETRGLFTFLYDLIKDIFYTLRHASDGAKKLLIYSVLASLGTGMTVPYTSLYLVSGLGLQPSLYGLLTNVTGLISVLLLLPATRIVERIGLRKSVIYASLSVPFNQLIFVRAKGTDDFVAWSAVGGASSALLGPSMTALQADVAPREVRGRLMALFSVFSLITAIPAQLLGGYLYYGFGPLAAFTASIPVFILSTLALTRIKNTYRNE
jgi:MFS family permease